MAAGARFGSLAIPSAILVMVPPDRPVSLILEVRIHCSPLKYDPAKSVFPLDQLGSIRANLTYGME